MKKILIVIIALSFFVSCGCDGCGEDRAVNSKRNDKSKKPIPVLVFSGKIGRIEVLSKPEQFYNTSRIIMEDGRSIMCYQVPMNPVPKDETAHVYKKHPRNSDYPCTIWKQRQKRWDAD